MIEIGLENKINEVTNLQHCESTIHNLVVNLVADTLYCIKKIFSTKVFLSCDGPNKGLHHIIKKISFWSLADNKLFLNNLDFDACVRTNLKTVEAIDFSTKKLIS